MVVDDHERRLGEGLLPTDKAGYAAMVKYAKTWPQRTWAVEGAGGAGRPLAQRLLEAGEHVVDVPAQLAARVRLFDTGHGRKTDAHDAHSIAIDRRPHRGPAGAGRRRRAPQVDGPQATVLDLPLDGAAVSGSHSGYHDAPNDHPAAGHEKAPAASPLVGGRSSVSTQSAPEGIRTPNLLIRSQMLYPLSYGRPLRSRATTVQTTGAPPGGEIGAELWNR